MSADNWAVCPRCFSEAQKAADAERERVMALYGSVPVEEFDRQRANLATPDPEQFRTLREDYEFCGASDGKVQADYACQCSQCGLGTELRASKRFWPESDDRQEQT